MPAQFEGAHKAFRELEHNFLYALTKGDTAAADFAHKYSALKGLAFPGSDTSFDDLSTLTLAHAAASSISIIAGSFDELESQWNPELDLVEQLVRSMSLSSHEDEASTLNTNLPIEPKTKTVISINRLPIEDLEPIREWLLQNLANPYPSLSAKRDLIKHTNVSMKILNDWFSHSRSKIGWTKIVKRHFEGDRPRAIDCAYRVLFGHESAHRQSKEVIRDFENMRRAAEALCGIEPSRPLVDKLSSTVPSNRTSTRKRTSRSDEEDARASPLSADDEERAAKRSRNDGSVKRTRRSTRPYVRLSFHRFSSILTLI